MLPVTVMNLKNHTVYDFELMEEFNCHLVVSMVLPGLPSVCANSGKNFSLLEQLPVTSRMVEFIDAPGA